MEIIPHLSTIHEKGSFPNDTHIYQNKSTEWLARVLSLMDLQLHILATSINTCWLFSGTVVRFYPTALKVTLVSFFLPHSPEWLSGYSFHPWCLDGLLGGQWKKVCPGCI